MKIELKNTDFKQLFEFLDDCPDTMPVDDIIENLRKQYDKAFNKYQNEKQKFEIGENIEFKISSWPKPNGTWKNGIIKKVSRRADGKYRYIIEYEDFAEDYDLDNEDELIQNSMVKRETNPLTEKNIRKI